MNIEESLGGITAAGEHSIEIDGISHPLPAVIAGRPQGSVETVFFICRQPEKQAQDLNEQSFQAALDDGAEVIIVGTGAKQQFLPPRTAAALAARGVGLECMSTAAACRTFMLLTAEGRRVWAWLW